jgi:predicted TPR repeat methyltransferase
MQKKTISDNKTLDKVYTAQNDQELMEAYKEWAGKYENDTVGTLGYVAHIATAKALAASLDDTDSRILDAGCGTGLVGSELAGMGYTNLDALDYSQEMLKQAEQKKIYSRHMQADLSASLDIEKNVYDAVVCTGTFTYGHVKAHAFDELVRITRPGGIICFTIREGAYEDYGYRDRMRELEQVGKWELVRMYDTEYLKEENISCKMCIYRVSS